MPRSATAALDWLALACQLTPPWSHDCLQATGQHREWVGLLPAGHPLRPWLLGLSLLETGSKAQAFAVPANALCVLTDIRQGALRWVAGTAGSGRAVQRCAAGNGWGVGPQTHARTHVAEPGSLCVSLLLHARVLPLALGTDAARWRNVELPSEPLATVCSTANALVRGEPLPAAAGPRQLALLEEWPRCQRVMQLLAQGRGELPAVATAGAGAARQLQRLCRRHVGLPPVVLARLFRLHQCAADALPDGRAGAGHALAAGYFDQSHMARDFRQLARTTPGGLALADAWALRAGATQLTPAYLWNDGES